jgi:hypothetical protein
MFVPKQVVQCLQWPGAPAGEPFEVAKKCWRRAQARTMTKVGILAGYELIMGRRSDLETVHRVLARYRLESILACCGRILT